MGRWPRAGKQTRPRDRPRSGSRSCAGERDPHRPGAAEKNLASGSVRITDILAAPPECAKTQKVHDLLLAVPKYGPARVARLLAYGRPSKTVAGLSDRQRKELIGRLSS